MGGHAKTNEGAAGCDLVGDGEAAGQEQGEGAGPESVHQAVRGRGDGGGECLGHDHSGDVDNHRIPGGAFLGGKDAGDGVAVESMGAEAVDRFCGQSDEAAGHKNAAGAVQCLECRRGMKVIGVNGQPQRLHGVYCLLLAGWAASGVLHTANAASRQGPQALAGRQFKAPFAALRGQAAIGCTWRLLIGAQNKADSSHKRCCDNNHSDVLLFSSEFTQL